jgi:ABC-type antimicrobial peptide transport system permease subunit
VKNKINIKKHGNFYIDSVHVCPECGCTITNNENIIRNLNLTKEDKENNVYFFKTFRKDTIVDRCRCDDCGCEFDIKIKDKIVVNYVDNLVMIILITIFIISMIFMICFGYYEIESAFGISTGIFFTDIIVLVCFLCQ